LAPKYQQKSERKMLMKLTSEVNFTNSLQAAFTFTDPKNAKRRQVVHLFGAFA
jgi:hypothetical protein